MREKPPLKVACLCPTYNHGPALLNNAIACFLEQDHTAATLFILDDSGRLPKQSGDRWEVHSVLDRFESLADKYDALLRIAGDEFDAVVVWDDDDVYLPWHLSTFAAALEDAPWVHPTQVWLLDATGPRQVPAAGFFHGALGVRTETLDAIGGWTGALDAGARLRADFDQLFMGVLSRTAPVTDPTGPLGPSYIYRWTGTLSGHGSALADEPQDTTWYARVVPARGLVGATLRPDFDADTRLIMDSARELLGSPAEQEPASMAAWVTGRRRGPIDITVGMAAYNDYDGIYFTVQALRLYHDLDGVELLVIDNFGCDRTQGFLAGLPHVRYVRRTDVTGTAAPRNLVFEEADGGVVLCCDPHVLFEAGALSKLRAFFTDHPDCDDLVQGPLIPDDGGSVKSHFDLTWANQMWGTWAHDSRADDPDGPPFDIPMQGLGVFSCHKRAWLGFNPAFRGFGGEEGYIHEKFRQAGRRCVCLPGLRWMHRFQTPERVPYTITVEDKLYNYLVGHAELHLDIRPVIEHFSTWLSDETIVAIAAEALWGVSGS